MRAQPVLINTPLGPLGAALTEPAGRPVAAALVLPGGGRRTGPNRLWGRLAESMAESGILVGRIDIPGHGDSDLISPEGKNVDQAMRYAGRWLSEYAGNLETTLVCGCYGSRLVGPILKEASVARMALIVPYLRTRYPNVRAFNQRARLARWMIRRRPGATDKKMVRELAAYSEKTPVWVLVGEHDVAARYVGALREAARDRNSVTIETIEGVAIHTHSSAQSQDLTIRHVTDWITSHIDTREPAVR